MACIERNVFAITSSNNEFWAAYNNLTQAHEATDGWREPSQNDLYIWSEGISHVLSMHVYTIYMLSSLDCDKVIFMFMHWIVAYSFRFYLVVCWDIYIYLCRSSLTDRRSERATLSLGVFVGAKFRFWVRKRTDGGIPGIPIKPNHHTVDGRNPAPGMCEAL